VGGDLVVVPHAALAVVPFGALPVGPGGPPLGTRFAMRFAHSLAALAAVEALPTPRLSALVGEPRRRALAAALVIGNPVMPRVPGAAPLERLPAAEREARALAARLGARARVGSAATESAARAALGRAPLVHFATHGFAYSTDARARDSFVALAADSASDGLLTVGEVLDDRDLRLVADLVVLSACQTGLGSLMDAEGTVGLARAFLAKGARSVLVSLWSVSDDATELLMRRFYAHWLDDADRPGKGEALRRAQGDVRRAPGFAHPRYWAAFQLVGAR
jgi:CHAT domain-containing protein